MYRPFFESSEGKPMWRCLRCLSEHSQLGTTKAHQLFLSGQMLALVCPGCADTVRREILELLPEPSFHSLPAGENDPGLPEGTVEALQTEARSILEAASHRKSIPLERALAFAQMTTLVAARELREHLSRAGIGVLAMKVIDGGPFMPRRLIELAEAVLKTESKGT